MLVHFDCRHFLGYKPCVFRRLCEDCPHYAPFGIRILVIKLAAMGDVLRTTPLLRGLRRAFPDGHVTWLTEANVLPMLEGIAEIDRLLAHTPETALQLQQESFDRLYCFDKEPKATALATKIRASLKGGFGLGTFGNVVPLNAASEYTFELGINDELKFRRNTKTYPQLVFDCAELPYPGPQEYIFPDLSAELARGRAFLQMVGAGPQDLKVGMNTGAGDAFATKKWTEEGYSELTRRIVTELGAKVVLLGGPKERERNGRIAAGAGCPVIDAGTNHPIREFAGIVGNCDLMVTGDTLAMHIGIGLRVPVLVILGPTCHQEIELYGRGAKIVSDFECSPCYLTTCPKDRTCMEATSPDAVFEAARRLLADTRTLRGSSA